MQPMIEQPSWKAYRIAYNASNKAIAGKVCFIIGHRPQNSYDIPRLIVTIDNEQWLVNPSLVIPY